ncbi:MULTISPECIES: phosphotransferase enzyme family protein [Kribbella]|uniref:Aminoglycoside phosphotransferase domain-containing protein n=1 Tax=Kribbella karoonensis TaxID=324851 RepID=A0ABN2DP77_9ACTN
MRDEPAEDWIGSDGEGPRWFVTADRCDTEQVKDAIEAAARTAEALAHCGYEFVVAPLTDRRGRLVREVLPGWVLVVLPYLQGWSTADGGWDDPAEREQIAGILGRLHAATPPKCLQRWDFAVPDRETMLTDLDEPWTSGPYGEPTRLRLAGAVEYVRGRLARYDALVRTIEASDDPWVVTHGEPHSANVVRTGDGPMHLIDWDTVKLAPRERDLAAILGGPTDVLPSYQAEVGAITPRPEALELFDLWWSLAEIASYVDLFRRPHVDSQDNKKSWRILTQYLPSTT